MGGRSEGCCIISRSSVSSAKADRRGLHRSLTDCCLTPLFSSLHFFLLSSARRRFYTPAPKAKGDLINSQVMSFSTNSESVIYLLDHKLLSPSSKLFCLLIPVHHYLGQRAGPALGSQKEGGLLELEMLFQLLLPWFLAVGTNF